MKLFNFKKKSASIPIDTELEARKKKNKSVVMTATKASNQLNKLIEENGFTVTIALAMGAKQAREGK